MEDASLADFLDEEGEEASQESGGPAPAGERHQTADATEPTSTGADAAAAGMDVTYAWSPHGVDCSACGASVTRRWRDGDALVCPECKDW